MCHLLLVVMITGPSSWPQQVWECAKRGPERYIRRPFCPQKNDSPDSPQITRLQLPTTLFVSWLTLLFVLNHRPPFSSKGKSIIPVSYIYLLPLCPFPPLNLGSKPPLAIGPSVLRYQKSAAILCKIPLEGTKPPLLRQAPLKINILIFFINIFIYSLILIQ